MERKSGKDAAPQDGDPIAEDLSAAAEEAGPIAEEAAGEGELHDTGVDVSTWDPFNLYAEVRGALARLGFSQPTPIQQECLPAAIRDRRDIIGAAQTVSSLHQKIRKKRCMAVQLMVPVLCGPWTLCLCMMSLLLDL